MEVRYSVGFTGVLFLIELFVYGQVGLLSLAGLIYTVAIGVDSSARVRLRAGYFALFTTTVTMIILASAAIGVFTPGVATVRTCREFRDATEEKLRYFDVASQSAYCDELSTLLRSATSMVILGIVLAILLTALNVPENKKLVREWTR